MSACKGSYAQPRFSMFTDTYSCCVCWQTLAYRDLISSGRHLMAPLHESSYETVEPDQALRKAASS